jgi:hypothetical protein
VVAYFIAALCAAASLAAPGAAPARTPAAPAVTPFLALPAGSPQSLAAAIATQQGYLTAGSDAAALDYFGVSVAVSGDTAIVGAYDHAESGHDGAGAAYVFTRTGGVWSLQQKLTADVPGANDQFGCAVAISGDTALVGAWNHLVPTTSRRGAAFVFTRSGGVWSQTQELHSDTTFDDDYGLAVALQGDTALVAAQTHGTAGPPVNAHGSVFVYTRSAGQFGNVQELTGNDVLSAEYFGSSVALDGDTAVVGASRHNHAGAGTGSGSAFVFTRSGGVWTQQQELWGDNVSTNDMYGVSVAVSGDMVLVGAELHWYLGQPMGSAYVFTRSGTAWTQQKQLTPPDGASYDYFGQSVALVGDRALIGSSGHDHTTTNKSGACYIFTGSGANWTQEQEFAGTGTGTGSADGDGFGNAVALTSDTAVVGAYLRTGSGPDTAGAAYAFLLGDTTDVTPPTTTVSGVPSGWSKTHVTVTMSATDDQPGTITTQYRLEGAAGWSTYAAPFTVSTQGTSTYEYRSFDAVPNYEVTRTFQVRVDAQGPQTLALAKVTVKKGKKATFKFRVNDVTPSAKVTIKIYKGAKCVKKIPVGSVSTNAAKTFKWTCRLPKRSYVWKVYATDQAGNAQKSVGSKTMKVK